MGSKSPNSVVVESQAYVSVEVRCGRTEWTGIDMGAEFRYDRLGLTEQSPHEQWKATEEKNASLFGHALTPTWKSGQVHLVLPASQVPYHARLRLFLPAGTDVTLRGIEFIDQHYDRSGKLVDEPGVAEVGLLGHCGHVDVRGPGNAGLWIAGQVDALKVDLPKGAVIAWLEPGTPAAAPIEIHAKAAVVSLPVEHTLAGVLPPGWDVGFTGTTSAQGGRGSTAQPDRVKGHPIGLDTPVGLVRYVHWGRVDDMSDADEGPAWRLDGTWVGSYASQGTWREQRLPPPDCIDMLAPECDRYAGRKH